MCIRDRPSWTVAGSALRGVGIPDCIADGRAAVSRVCSFAQGNRDHRQPDDHRHPHDRQPDEHSPAAHAREDTRMSPPAQPTPTQTSDPAAAPAAVQAPVTAPATKVTAR